MSETLAVQAPQVLAGPLTGDPEEVVTRATEIAKRLRSIVEDRKLSVRIGQKNHVMVEGWTTMLAMLGVFPRTDWTRPMDSPEGSWEARVTLVHFGTGKEIASGEAMCSKEEKRWATAEAYAIRSMAQTRATAKAARLGFSWIVALAGYDATPAEEMSVATVEHAEPSRPAERPPRGVSSPLGSAKPAIIVGAPTDGKGDVHPADGGITSSEQAFLSVAQRIGAATTREEAKAVRPNEEEAAKLSPGHLDQLRNMVRTKAAALGAK